MIARQSTVPLLSLMCDRSDLIIENILLVHDFSQPKKENMSLLHKLIKAFNAKVHLLMITKDTTDSNSKTIYANMEEFATLNGILNFDKHVLGDSDVENGVIHYNQMHEMDIIYIGTHGKGGLFHSSIAEKLINHIFKPIISFHLKS
jgi:nucleotide-binding universal stress UspA family protein